MLVLVFENHKNSRVGILRRPGGRREIAKNEKPIMSAQRVQAAIVPRTYTVAKFLLADEGPAEGDRMV